MQKGETMNDYISRQMAIESLKICELGEEMSIIELMPSADVVEAVRCKDCKYGSPNGVYGCRLERYNFNDESVRMYGEDYCSYGERRTDA